VLRSDYPALELLVLDDCSRDLPICEIVAERFGDPRITCFHSERQLGVAGGRNFLMQRAQGEILIFIDDDAVFLTPTAIRRAVELLTRNPDTGILAFKVVNHENGRKRLRTPFSKLTRRRWPDIHNRQQLVSYYLGTGHAIRRELIERCGLYQDNFMFGEEELDLSYRAIHAGYQILYVPSIVVHHYPQTSVIEGDSPRRSFTELELHVRNRIWIAYKHLPFPYLFTNPAVWLSIYAIEAVGTIQPTAYIRGISAGMSGLRNLSRRPLNAQGIAYLRKNFGRLWY
jgi:GT2 family glycosyltransferase